MPPLLEFGECIKDSPAFRESLHQAEADTAALQNLLEKVDVESSIGLTTVKRLCDFMLEDMYGSVATPVSKQSSLMNEAEKHYNSAHELFKQALQEMRDYYDKDSFLKDVINQYLHVLTELNSFHQISDKAQQSINQKMTHFLKSDVRANYDLKKAFDKSSNDYDNALSKYVSVSRLKANEVEETETALSTQKLAFRKSSMDYVFQMNMLHKNKRICTISQMTSFMHSLRTYFHQGFELFQDMEPFLKKTADQLDELSSNIESEKDEMITQKERYQAMTGDSSMYIKQLEPSSERVIEGYLFKRASNAFKTWSRRWFSIHSSKLLYQGKIKAHHHEAPIVIVEDLRLCTIRIADDVERRFCFEVISPSKSFLLQAESEDVRQAWVQAIQSSIQDAYKASANREPAKHNEVASNLINNVRKNSPVLSHSSSFSQTSSKASDRNSLLDSPKDVKQTPKVSVLEKIMEAPGNTCCADCKKQEARWASVNLGVVLCIECSGVHRSLGVHISKVRSLTLDSWEPEVIAIMQSLGNDRVNEIYEARIGSKQIRPGCTNKDRSDFIQAKYVRKEFRALLPDEHTHSTVTPDKKIRRWKIRKSKPRRKRDKKINVASFVKDEDDTGNQDTSDNSAAEQGEKKKTRDCDVFIFGKSKVPDPEGETEIENSDVEDITNLDANLLLYKAAKLGSLPVMLLAKANGANLNWHNPKDELKSPLMQAATGGSIRACEYLLINGAKINEADENGKTALHYATTRNNTGVACQFLKRRADHKIPDKDGITPLQIAIESANADIVTLIRLKQMNDEMLDTDPGSAQTDTLVTDVFRDFSHRAASNDLTTPDGSISSPLFGSPKLDSDVFENSTSSLDESVVTKSENDSASPATEQKDDCASTKDNEDKPDGQIMLKSEDDASLAHESTV